MTRIPPSLQLLHLLCLTRGEAGTYSLVPTTLCDVSHRDIDGLSDVNDSDMADDLPVTCSDESKVLTSDDTSLDQAEGEDTLS